MLNDLESLRFAKRRRAHLSPHVLRGRGLGLRPHCARRILCYGPCRDGARPPTFRSEGRGRIDGLLRASLRFRLLSGVVARVSPRSGRFRHLSSFGGEVSHQFFLRGGAAGFHSAGRRAFVWCNGNMWRT